MNRAQKEVLQTHLDAEKKIIRELQQVYKKAREDCEQKIRELSGRTDMENLQSIVYQKQYQEALKKQLSAIIDSLQSNEFTTIADYLQTCYENGYVGVMYDLQSQGIPIITPINQEQVTRALQTDSKISQGLYSRLGEDTSRLKKSIRAELSRGVANGSSWNEIAVKIAKGMNSPYNKAINNAIRIARTEGHRVQTASALDAQYEAKSKGANVLKQWDATLDGRTRPHHRELDGQIREVEEDFEIGSLKASAPGYFGVPGEDCNCRCALLQRARWGLDEDERKTLQERAAYFGLDKTKNFEEFKQKYLKAVENDETQVENSENSDTMCSGRRTECLRSCHPAKPDSAWQLLLKIICLQTEQSGGCRPAWFWGGLPGRVIMIRVTVWNENVHEREQPEVRAIYPEGIHGCIAGFLGHDKQLCVRTATLDMPEHGLTEEVLENTDVLIFWNHICQEEFSDEVARRVQAHVLQGMGLIALHSAHRSKVLQLLLGTGMTLRWRHGDRERLFVTSPAHPIAAGLPPYFEIPEEEMYGEYFDIPKPDNVVFIGWFAGGEVFRSGCTFQRGYGRIFYFQPGHEEYPVYHMPWIQKIIRNAVYWCAPVQRLDELPGCPETKPLENR